MPIIFLSLGSNLGDRYRNLELAYSRMQDFICPIICSKIIESKPQYVEEQPDFLNQVIKGETLLSPEALLESTQRLEKELGRTHTFKHGPRTIDIDIISYDDLILKNDHLSIPHPFLYERHFVLEPLLEIEPLWTCPLKKKTVQELLNELNQLEISSNKTDA